MKELETFKKYLVEEEISKSLKTSNNRSDIKGTEAARKAEWKARYGSMDGFDKAYPQYSRNNIPEQISANGKYIVSIQTEYGTLNNIEVYAENEDDAFNKALQKAEDAVWTSKLDQIERL